MSKRPKINELPPEQRDQVKQWLEHNRANLPEAVKIVIEQHDVLVEALEGNRRKLSQVIVQLRRAMGIVPSSEQRSSGDPIGAMNQADKNDSSSANSDKTKSARQEKPSEKSKRLATWHRGLANRHNRKAKKQKVFEDTMKVEDIELSPEELAQIEKENEEFEKNLQLGDIDPKFESSKQAFMTGVEARIEEELEYIKAPDTGDAKVFDKFFDTRERYDFNISICRIEIDVEKKVIEDSSGERKIVAGSTHHLGPPRYDVTWNFLANMTLQVVQYAMPMNRLARMLSTESKQFTAAYLSRLLNYVAHRFVPIYIELIDQLSDSEVLIGDDTSVRVLELQKAIKNQVPINEQPWDSYRTTKKARESNEEPKKKGQVGSHAGM